MSSIDSSVCVGRGKPPIGVVLGTTSATTTTNTSGPLEKSESPLAARIEPSGAERTFTASGGATTTARGLTPP